jgi:hypothetical protein
MPSEISMERARRSPRPLGRIPCNSSESSGIAFVPARSRAVFGSGSGLTCALVGFIRYRQGKFSLPRYVRYHSTMSLQLWLGALDLRESWIC